MNNKQAILRVRNEKNKTITAMTCYYLSIESFESYAHKDIAEYLLKLNDDYSILITFGRAYSIEIPACEFVDIHKELQNELAQQGRDIHCEKMTDVAELQAWRALRMHSAFYYARKYLNE